MRYLVIILSLVLVVAFSVPAFADPAAGAYDNTDADLALPNKSGYRLCLNSIAFDATNATDDINFWVTTGDESVIQADAAAAATALTITYNANIATDAQVILVRADGTYAETKALSALATTGAATIGALDYAWKKGDKLYEAQVMLEWADVGTAAVTRENSTGILCGPIGSPLAAIIDANLMTYMSGFYAN
jgi:hypothetical protein